MSCVGCGIKDNDRQLESACIKAQEHANKEKKQMAVYKDETGEWQYKDAFLAAAERIHFEIVVSYHR